MTLDDLDFVDAPGRHVFSVTDRLTVVALEPIDGLVVVSYFFDDQVLVCMTEEAAGEA